MAAKSNLLVKSMTLNPVNRPPPNYTIHDHSIPLFSTPA